MAVLVTVALLTAVVLGVSEVRRWASGDTLGAQMLHTLTLLVWRLLKALIWLWATAYRFTREEVRSW